MYQKLHEKFVWNFLALPSSSAFYIKEIAKCHVTSTSAENCKKK